MHPDRKADVYHRISEALVSGQDSVERDGLRAVAGIILNGVATGADSVEPDPVAMLRQYLTWRPARSINSALTVIIGILRNAPIKFPSALGIATEKLLERLLDETAYNNDNSGLSFDEKLEVRRSSSILAAELWAFYHSLGPCVPEVLVKWRDQCVSAEEFSEIRNPWEYCD